MPVWRAKAWKSRTDPASVVDDHGYQLYLMAGRPESRGTVRLRSRDFRDKPRVDPRYFTDPEGYDLRIMTAGIRRAREIVAQSALAASESAPDARAAAERGLAAPYSAGKPASASST